MRLIEIAFTMLGIPNPIRVTSDGDDAIAYLRGEGDYADRTRYPLPFIVILDWTFLLRSGLHSRRPGRYNARLVVRVQEACPPFAKPLLCAKPAD